MNITKSIDADVCTLSIEGDIDTTTSAILDKAVEECLPQCSRIVLDMKDVKYISSAGIRSIVKTRKLVGSNNLVLRNLRNNIMEIIKMTGFADRLIIE